MKVWRIGQLISRARQSKIMKVLFLGGGGRFNVFPVGNHSNLPANIPTARPQGIYVDLLGDAAAAQTSLLGISSAPKISAW